MTAASIRLIALALAVGAPLGACAVVQEKTLGESFDDASASSQIKAKLLSTSTKAFNEVDVEVTGGLALLTGRVPTPEERVEAERIAWSVNTIDEIANEIEVIDKSSVLSNVNDEWITAQVRSRLVADPDIKSVNYNIETFNGVVYLLGLAMSEQELKSAATHASVVRGVKKVVSYVKMRDRQAPSFAPDGPAPVYAPPPAAEERPVSKPHVDPYQDPYADPYAEPNDVNPYADDEYSDLVGGTD